MATTRIMPLHVGKSRKESGDQAKPSHRESRGDRIITKKLLQEYGCEVSKRGKSYENRMAMEQEYGCEVSKRGKSYRRNSLVGRKPPAWTVWAKDMDWKICGQFS